MLDLDALAKQRERELGLAGRHLPAARSTSAACCRCRAAAPTPSVVREFDTRDEGVRQGRLRAARGQEPRRLERRRHHLRRHRLRPRLADQLGLPAHRQGVEARHAAGRGEDACSRARPSDVARRRRSRLVPRAATATSSSARIDFYDERDSSCRDGRQAGQDRQARATPIVVLLPATSCCCSCAATGRSAARPSPPARCWPRTLKDFLAGKRELDDAVRAGHEPLAAGYSGHQERAAAQRARQRAQPAARRDAHEKRQVAEPQRLPGARRWARYDASAVDDERGRPTTGSPSPTSCSPTASTWATCGTGKREALKSAPGVLRRRRAARSSSTSRPRRTARACPTSRSRRKDLPLDGSNPTLLYGYGGFEVSLTPGYNRQRRRGLAGAGRRLRGGQHPRRRRVRPGLAPGGAEARTASAPTTTSSPSPRT